MWLYQKPLLLDFDIGDNILNFRYFLIIWILKFAPLILKWDGKRVSRKIPKTNRERI